MEKKRKWERDYESYANSTELNERIEYLTDLVNAGVGGTGEIGRLATKEEYKELKKLTAIKNNLPKVKNILELREQLVKEKEEIKKAIELKQRLVQKSKDCQLLEYKLNGIDIEKDGKKVHIEGLLEKREALDKKLSELNAKIANPNLDPAEKTKLKADKIKLEGEISDNDNKIQDNNKEFGDKQEQIKEYQKIIKMTKFKDVSLEDLKKQSIQISSNISECNIACNRLMQGGSWQQVEVALNKYETEKLTATGKNATKIKQNREAAKAANAKREQNKSEQTKTQPTNANTEKVVTESSETNQEPEQTKKEETALSVPTGWQKIKGYAKKVFEKWFMEEVDEEKINIEEDKEKKEAPKKKSIFARIKAGINAFMQKEETEQTDSAIPNTPTQADSAKPDETKKEETEKQETKQDAFRQYLRDVAEKGIEGIEQDRQAAEKAKEAATRAKLENYRAEAQKREAERNQAYAAKRKEESKRAKAENAKAKAARAASDDGIEI